MFAYPDLPNRLNVLLNGALVVALFKAVVPMVPADLCKQGLVIVVVFGELVGKIEETSSEKLLKLDTVFVLLDFTQFRLF